ncbi:MAG: hypothetical protein GWQ08_04955 [Verrucomicrobiaceae bacterium]|nr:hypothetical protein [Verrucomicrobiaceae bacterium]
MRYFLNALLILALFSGCRSTRLGRTVGATERAPNSPPSAKELVVGEIAFVRGDQTPPFVLINLEQGVRLPDGATLRGVSEGGPSALRTTLKRRGAHQVATIVSGRPKLGDQVVLDYPKGDGSDEVTVNIDAIPRLLRAPTTRNASGKPPVALRRPQLHSERRLDSVAEAEPDPLSPNAFTPPAMRDDVEPRRPVRDMDPLPLPQWEPDEGETFMERLPE